MTERTVLNDTMKLVARRLSDQKEQIIRDTIDRVIGNSDWSINDIAYRGGFNSYPDGREVFHFDGVELIEFYLPSFNQTESMMTSNFNYRELK